MLAFLELFRQTAAVQQEIPGLEAKLAQAQALPDSPRAILVRDELLTLLQEQRQRRLQIGAVGQLLMQGEQIEIMALDDEETHKAAHPVQDGKFLLSTDAIAAREEAMVARPSSLDEPVSVIVLGAAHNFGGLIKGRGWTYDRIKPAKVKQLTAAKS